MRLDVTEEGGERMLRRNLEAHRPSAPMVSGLVVVDGDAIRFDVENDTRLPLQHRGTAMAFRSCTVAAPSLAPPT